MKKETAEISVFKGSKIRKIWQGGTWWFSVTDVVAALTDSPGPRDYWYRMKIREKTESGIELSTFCRQLKLKSADGKSYLTDCADTEGIFRVIQSIPSKKAEPFKRWLAKVGKERIDEVENPELGMLRTKELYEKKGYPKEWIEKRLRGVAVRQKLTDEWDSRGAQTDLEYALLTNEIMQGTFELKVDEYKKHKGLIEQNLRDHMTDLELIITMLGEAATTKFSQDRDSRGFPKLRRDAKDGGGVAGRTRKDIERRTGTKIVSKANYLPHQKKKEIT